MRLFYTYLKKKDQKLLFSQQIPAEIIDIMSIALQKNTYWLLNHLLCFQQHLDIADLFHCSFINYQLVQLTRLSSIGNDNDNDHSGNKEDN